MLEAYVQKWSAANLDNFRYVLRSGMMGWFTLMLDTTAWSAQEHAAAWSAQEHAAAWSAQEHAAAREAIALYKSKLRPLIREAISIMIMSRRGPARTRESGSASISARCRLFGSTGLE
jgi:hypothetical protein